MGNRAGSNPVGRTILFAGVMELADVQDSKSCGGNTVWVRPPSPAPRSTGIQEETGSYEVWYIFDGVVNQFVRVPDADSCRVHRIDVFSAGQTAKEKGENRQRDEKFAASRR